MSTQTIALVGTGRLAALIANAVLDQPDVQLRLLVRRGLRDKVAELEQRGALVVEGTLRPDAGFALASLCEGASTVICAVQGGPDVIIGQTHLLQAARGAGVHRFIPSDYSQHLFKVTPSDIPALEWRRQFALVADAERGNVQVVHVSR